MITVLLIDDPPIIRVDFQHILEQNGDIRVIAQACDAETGYGTFVSHAPDVSVTDISMPGAAGLEFMRKILVCNYQATPASPVVPSGITVPPGEPLQLRVTAKFKF